jgi:hypothetical protein
LGFRGRCGFARRRYSVHGVSSRVCLSIALSVLQTALSGLVVAAVARTNGKADGDNEQDHANNAMAISLAPISYPRIIIGFSPAQFHWDEARRTGG